MTEETAVIRTHDYPSWYYGKDGQFYGERNALLVRKHRRSGTYDATLWQLVLRVDSAQIWKMTSFGWYIKPENTIEAEQHVRQRCGDDTEDAEKIIAYIRTLPHITP